MVSDIVYVDKTQIPKNYLKDQGVALDGNVYAIILDVGSVTVGVAVSDLLGYTAQPVETIRINEAKADYGFERLAELVKAYQPAKFVLGLPKHMNNDEGIER